MYPKNRYLRWLALITIIANVAFNFLYPFILPQLPEMAEVTDSYSPIFRPAGYAFAIWGVIYVAFITYGIVQLLPKHRLNMTYDKLALPVTISQVLCSVWILFFLSNQIAISTGIIFVTWLVGICMFTQAYKWYRAGWVTGNITIPFSLFFGWLTCALLAQTDILMNAMGWEIPGMPELALDIAMIGLAAITGIFISLPLRNYIVPLVVAWALIAIYVQQRYVYENIAMAALISAIVVMVFAVAAMLRPGLYNQTRFTQKHSPSLH